MLGASIRVIARATDTEGRFIVFEQTTPSGWRPPRHVHANEDEILYVLEGSYEVSLGEERRAVSAGGCAILPRGIPHGFRNLDETPGRFLCIIAPGGTGGVLPRDRPMLAAAKPCAAARHGESITASRCCRLARKRAQRSTNRAGLIYGTFCWYVYGGGPPLETGPKCLLENARPEPDLR